MRLPRSAKLLAPSIALAAIASPLPPARADVPTGTPTFGSPLSITNSFFPVQPGAMKVFRGRDGKDRTVAVDLHLADTRTFSWNGGTVETRIVKEIEFVNGRLHEVSLNHYAQADDGTVYYFGETGEEFENGVVTETDGWLVGGPTLPSDPPNAVAVTDPSIAMPAIPEVGDHFFAEFVPGAEEEEITVLAVGKKLKVEFGKLQGVMMVHEIEHVEGDEEINWIAPGLGTVKSKAKGEKSELVATTLLP